MELTPHQRFNRVLYELRLSAGTDPDCDVFHFFTGVNNYTKVQRLYAYFVGCRINGSHPEEYLEIPLSWHDIDATDEHHHYLYPCGVIEVLCLRVVERRK